MSLLHAALGVTGLLLLIYPALTTGISMAPLVALLILVIAAMAGIYLASIHARGEIAKKPVVFIHAVVAVIGFLVLLGAVFNMISQHHAALGPAEPTLTFPELYLLCAVAAP